MNFLWLLYASLQKKSYLCGQKIGHTDSSRIHELLEGAMTDKIDDRETFMKGIDYSYYYEQEE
jgi:cell filamentation protein